jgi:hypothetical protein
MLSDMFNINCLGPNADYVQFEMEMLEYAISGTTGGDLYTPPAS